MIFLEVYAPNSSRAVVIKAPWHWFVPVSLEWANDR